MTTPHTTPQKPEDHIGLIGLLCARFRTPGSALPDLRVWSDACVGLMHACAKYTPSRGAAFSTFAKWCIRSAICDGAKQNRKYTERYRPTDQIGHAIALTDTSDATARSAAEDSDWLDWAIARLPTRWQAIIAARRSGATTRDIAAALQICTDSVLTREREALRYLRNLARITCGDTRRHA